MKRFTLTLMCIALVSVWATEVTAQDKNTKNDLNFQKSLHTNLNNTPANVLTNFGTDFPGALNINWSSEPGVWYVRCDDMNAYKCLTMYMSNGTKKFTARNLKFGEVPPAVTMYMMTSGEISSAVIIQIEVPGDPNFWRITTASGIFIFIAADGIQTINTIKGFATY